MKTPDDRPRDAPANYAPLSRRERAVGLALAGIATTALLSGTLMLFHAADSRPDWAGLVATPAGLDPSCPSRDPRAQECQRRTASRASADTARQPSG